MNNPYKSLTIFIAIFVAMTSLATLPTLSTRAQEESQEATTSSDVDPETVKENIKKRIQEAIQNNPEEAKLTPLYGWVARIESLTNDSLTISSDQGTRIVSVTDETTIVKDDEDSELEDLAIDDYIIAMGRVDEQDVLNALRIVAQEDAFDSVEKRTAFGVISEIDLDEEFIIIQDSNNQLTLTLNRNSFMFENLSDQTELELEDLNTGDTVVVVYLADEDDPSILNIESLLRTEKSSTSSDADSEADESSSETPFAVEE